MSLFSFSPRPASTLVSNAESVSDLQPVSTELFTTESASKFQDFIDSILLIAASKGVSETRDAIMAALAEDSERESIFAFLTFRGFPTNLKPEHRIILVEAVLPFLESDKDFSWEVLSQALKICVTEKDLSLYSFLGREFNKRDVPDAQLWHSALAYSDFSCINIKSDPAFNDWLSLFKSRGSKDAFYIMSRELEHRLERGELSSYDHLVAALCTPSNINAMQMLEEFVVNHVVTKLIPITSQQPKQESVTANNDSNTVNLAQKRLNFIGDGLRSSARSVPIAAIMTMLSAGPEYALSGYTLLLSTALGFAQVLIKDQLRRPKLAASANNKPDLKAAQTTQNKSSGYAYTAFAERVCATLNASNETSELAQSILKQLNMRLSGLN